MPRRNSCNMLVSRKHYRRATHILCTIFGLIGGKKRLGFRRKLHPLIDGKMPVTAVRW